MRLLLSRGKEGHGAAGARPCEISADERATRPLLHLRKRAVFDRVHGVTHAAGIAVRIKAEFTEGCGSGVRAQCLG